MKKAASKKLKRKDYNPATAVRLPTEIKAKAKKQAEKEGRSLSNLIIEAIKKYIS